MLCKLFFVVVCCCLLLLLLLLLCVRVCVCVCVRAIYSFLLLLSFLLSFFSSFFFFTPSSHLTRSPLFFLPFQILFFLLRYNFATSDNDHGRFGEVAAAILSFASAPGGGTSPSASESSLSPPSSTTLDNSITCRNLFYRSIACFTRTRPLHNMLVNGGLIKMLKQFIDRMLFEDNIDYEVEGMNPVEASTIGIIILCT